MDFIVEHWQKQFIQLEDSGLFVPQTSPFQGNQQSFSSTVCPLCHMPHASSSLRDVPQPTEKSEEGWKQYWRDRGQLWRIEPEISLCRQYTLAQQGVIQPNGGESFNPFEEVSLSRADVEWLLATLEDGRGPIDWDDESQRNRKGLNLIGAQLEGVDLSGLPLTKLEGGMASSKWIDAKMEGRIAFRLLERTGIGHQKPATSLKNAILVQAHLEWADLTGVNLEEADLTEANLFGANLEGTIFLNAQLRGAFLFGTHLEGAILALAHLEGTDLRKAHLEEALIIQAHLEGADLTEAQLKSAILSQSRLEGANLTLANLEDTNLERAHLEGANLKGAQLKGVYLKNAHLEGADLRLAKLDEVNFTNVVASDRQGNGPLLADVSWGNTNISLIDWSSIVQLGDEHQARQKQEECGKKKDRSTRLQEYRDALRATYQVAALLQDQGLKRDGTRFEYRAKCLERTVRWYELWNIAWKENGQAVTLKSIIAGLFRAFPVMITYIFSWFIFLLAGYGYRLRYCLLWYVLTIVGFTMAYLVMEPHYFTWWMALGESVNVFHGRGAAPIITQLEHPIRFTILTVAEAWIGLVIEVVLVATVLQRFFNK